MLASRGNKHGKTTSGNVCFPVFCYRSSIWDKYNIYYAELEPGDSFCFPPWMWHAVESDGYTLGMVKVFERNEDYYKKYHKLRMRYMHLLLLMVFMTQK